MQFFQDDLLKVRHGTIVHGCNAQGKMNSGVAKAVRATYPEAYRKYVLDLELFHLKLGGLSVFDVSSDLRVISAITQRFYGYEEGKRYVSYDAIDEVFDNIFAQAEQQYAVSMPLIGAGLGGGSWKVIREIIEFNAKRYAFPEHKIHIYSINFPQGILQ